MTWTDHRHDILPAAADVTIIAAAFLEDPHGRVLLQRDAHDNHWTLPGSIQHAGERTREAVTRCLAQHLGIAVDVSGVVGIYHHSEQLFTVCLRARPLTPHAALPQEARWIARGELDSLPIHHDTRARITHGLEHRTRPHIDLHSPTPRWRRTRLGRR